MADYLYCYKDAPCEFCGFCKDCAEVHEENKDSWMRYFGEYFNNSYFWRKDLRIWREDLRSEWRQNSMERERCNASTYCLFCGICKECGEEITKISWWRMWGRYFN